MTSKTSLLNGGSQPTPGLFAVRTTPQPRTPSNDIITQLNAHSYHLKQVQASSCRPEFLLLEFEGQGVHCCIDFACSVPLQLDKNGRDLKHQHKHKHQVSLSQQISATEERIFTAIMPCSSILLHQHQGHTASSLW